MITTNPDDQRSRGPATRRPTVSVVIPCYRYGHFLGDCVRSVLGQEGVDTRVLIIDDASPDDSAQVARALASEQERVEVHVHDQNRGHIETYNEGLLDWADGDYSVLLSADDLLTPGALARATGVLEANPRVGFVYGHPIRWSDDVARPVACTRSDGINLWSGIDWLQRVCRLRHSVISSPEVVVRTEVQKRIGGYLPALPHTGDIEMWLRFAVHSDVAYIKGADQAFYRTHSANMTKERVTLVDLQQRKAAFDAIFDAYSTRIPSARGVRAGVNRGLAREALWEACSAYEREQVDTTPIADLREFARAAYGRIDRLPEYWGLRWRRRLGAHTCARIRPFLLSTVSRRVRNELWWRRWAREGV